MISLNASTSPLSRPSGKTITSGARPTSGVCKHFRLSGFWDLRFRVQLEWSGKNPSLESGLVRRHSPPAVPAIWKRHLVWKIWKAETHLDQKWWLWSAQVGSSPSPAPSPACRWPPRVSPRSSRPVGATRTGRGRPSSRARLGPHPPGVRWLGHPNAKMGPKWKQGATQSQKLLEAQTHPATGSRCHLPL